jgi:hypothetical protein
MLRTAQQDLGDGTISDCGGYVSGFEDVFVAGGFALPAADIEQLDPLFRCSCTWGARRSRAHAMRAIARGRALSSAICRTRVLRSRASRRAPGSGRKPAQSSARARHELLAPRCGGPAQPFHVGSARAPLGRALRLGGPAFALDAACASSPLRHQARLRRAARWAGGSDAGRRGELRGRSVHPRGLYCASLRSARPDGVGPSLPMRTAWCPRKVPCLVALRRLSDALRDGDSILGVIRGVGLSNDGRGRRHARAFTSRARSGRCARPTRPHGSRPADVSLVECHATGTLVGDADRASDADEVFGGRSTPLRAGVAQGQRRAT